MSSYRDLLDAAFRSLPLQDVLQAPPDALKGVSASDAEKLAAAFSIRTVRDLAESPVFRKARSLLAAAGLPAFDPGPPDFWAQTFAEAPLSHDASHPSNRFRRDFGPVYYRGRLDGTARVLVVGQDPSTNEILAQRIFVGLSGQGVQRLLAKLGLLRSYVMLNTFLFSVFGQVDEELRAISLEPEVLNFRNRCFDAVRASNPLEGVIAFGAGARHALQHWPGGEGLPMFFLAHPAAPDSFATESWNSQLGALLSAVAPDLDGSVDSTPYGTTFTDEDSSPIPPFDLPFGLPEWHGRDGGHSGRDGNQRIIWEAPPA